MKPDKILDITACKKCGSYHIKFEYYFKSRVSGSQAFLHELEGFFVKPKCAECNYSTGMRWFDSVEDAVLYWND